MKIGSSIRLGAQLRTVTAPFGTWPLAVMSTAIPDPRAPFADPRSLTLGSRGDRRGQGPAGGGNEDDGDGRVNGDWNGGRQGVCQQHRMCTVCAPYMHVHLLSERIECGAHPQPAKRNRKQVYLGHQPSRYAQQNSAPQRTICGFDRYSAQYCGVALASSGRVGRRCRPAKGKSPTLGLDLDLRLDLDHGR